MEINEDIEHLGMISPNQSMFCVQPISPKANIFQLVSVENICELCGELGPKTFLVLRGDFFSSTPSVINCIRHIYFFRN